MESREVYGFVVLRRGPPFPDNFHYSLSTWELSRKAMVLEKQRKKQGKNCPITISNHDVQNRGAHVTLKEITQPLNDRQNEAIRSFCADVIIVAVHEVDKEDTAEKEIKLNDEIDFLPDRGDGHHPAHVKEAMPVEFKKNGVPEQNLQCQRHPLPESDEKLHEIAKSICQQAISKALYEVSKDNLEQLQQTGHHPDNFAMTCSNSNKEDLSPEVTLTKVFDKTEEGQSKKLSKAELKEQKKHQRFQEKKAIAYIKMVNEKYKERNEAINKLLKDQAKEEKKRQEIEKKQQRDALKVEKKEKAKRARLEKERKNNGGNEDSNENERGSQNGNAKGRSFTYRIREVFGCFFH